MPSTVTNKDREQSLKRELVKAYGGDFCEGPDWSCDDGCELDGFDGSEMVFYGANPEDGREGFYKCIHCFLRYIFEQPSEREVERMHDTLSRDSDLAETRFMRGAL